MNNSQTVPFQKLTSTNFEVISNQDLVALSGGYARTKEKSETITGSAGPSGVSADFEKTKTVD